MRWRLLLPLLTLSWAAAVPADGRASPQTAAEDNTSPLDDADQAMQRGDWAQVSASLSEYGGVRDARYLALAGRLAIQQRHYDAAVNNFDAAIRHALPRDRAEMRQYRDHARRCGGAAASGLEDISTLKPVKRVRPVAPIAAIEQNIDGLVETTVYIDERGRVKSALVLTANPPKVFDDSVLIALRRWRFEPPGAPSCVLIPFTFRLREG
ncbi:MAG: energy transducer TonB [Myxococcota bacterium]